MFRIFSLLFLTCSILCPFSSYAQSPNDSLWKIWGDVSQADTSRFRAMYELVLAAETADSTLSLLHLLYAQAETRGDRYWMATAAYEMAGAYQEKGEWEAGLAQAKHTQQLSEEIGDDVLRGKAIIARGFLLENQDQSEMAMDTIKRGIRILQGTTDQAEAAASMRELSVLYHNQSQWDSAIVYLYAALSINRVLTDQAAEVRLLHGIGTAYYQLNNDDSARLYFTKSLTLAEETDNFSAAANALVDLGHIAVFDGEYDEAMAYFERGLAIAEKQNLVKPTGWLLQSVGLVFFAQKELDKALQYFEKSLATEEAKTDKNLQMDLMDVMGLSFSRKEDPDQALVYFSKGLALAEERKDPFFLAKFAKRMGLINLRNDDYVASLANYQQALAIYRKIKNIDGEANCLFRIGQVYQGLSDWRKAIAAYEQALKLAQSINAKPLSFNVSQRLHDCYRELGQYQKALETYKLYIELRDSLSNRDNQRATLRYEFETKALSDSLAFVQEKAATNLAYQRQISQRNSLIVGVLTLGLLAFFFFRYRQRIRNQERERELQHERERKEQLAELNALKSRFFANISHELRTPLTLILGPLSHLLDQSDAWETESVRQQLTVIQRNGKSLMHLIEEILDLSRLEANQLALEEEETALIPFVEQVFATFELPFQNQHITYSLDSALEEELHVLLDQGKVKKVLNNFLSNALKFTPEGGNIRLSLTEMDDRLQFKVSDTGKGIHPDDLPHVFDRFYQAKHSDAASQGGTGIGLGLVKEIAHLMDGQAYAESSLGEGSRFYFEIPSKKLASTSLLAQTPKIVEEIAAIHSIGSDFTILVVEDNQDMQAFIHQLLAPHYARVLLAGNGAEGLAMLQEHGREVHLIISDIMMPEVDGLSMLKEIKSQSEWQGIPVIMLTALAAERDKLKALTIGVDDYLSKPFSVQELQVRVQNLLYNAQQRREWQQSPEYLEHQEPADESDSRQVSVTDQAWIREMEQIVESSLPEEKLSVENLAEAAHLSPRQLRRRIKAITGLSPAKFIKEIQLQLARQELEEGKIISLSDVAFKCGFEHQGTFSTLFKARYGKSPSEYLKGNMAG